MGELWGVLAAVLSSGLGGTSIGATRYLVNAVDPLAIGSFRFGIGFLLLLPLTLLKGGKWPARGDWPATAGLGLLFFALFPILFNASLIFTTAARGALRPGRRLQFALPAMSRTRGLDRIFALSSHRRALLAVAHRRLHLRLFRIHARRDPRASAADPDLSDSARSDARVAPP